MVHELRAIRGNIEEGRSMGAFFVRGLFRETALAVRTVSLIKELPGDRAKAFQELAGTGVFGVVTQGMVDVGTSRPGLVAGQVVQGEIIVDDGGIGAERQRPVQVGFGLGEAARIVVEDSAVERPLLKLDGYYMLSDVIEIPNLRQLSNRPGITSRLGNPPRLRRPGCAERRA
jgi:hypothetical protein